MISQPLYSHSIEDGYDFNGNLLGMVILMTSKRLNFTHCGLAYDLQDNPQVLHLATHNDLENDSDLSGFSVFIEPGIPKELQEIIMPLCLVIKDKMQNEGFTIPYGFSYEDYAKIYESEDTLTLSKKGIGLTCATFVLTLFHSCGIDLINLQDWIHREEDISWQNGIIKFFYNNKIVEHSHLLGMLAERGASRYKPEEVSAASALYDNGYAQSDRIIAEGEVLNRYLHSI